MTGKDKTKGNKYKTQTVPLHEFESAEIEQKQLKYSFMIEQVEILKK